MKYEIVDPFRWRVTYLPSYYKPNRFSMGIPNTDIGIIREIVYCISSFHVDGFASFPRFLSLTAGIFFWCALKACTGTALRIGNLNILRSLHHCFLCRNKSCHSLFHSCRKWYCGHTCGCVFINQLSSSHWHWGHGGGRGFTCFHSSH